jgi:hypothetical protein
MQSFLHIYCYLIKGTIQYTFHRGSWEEVVQEMEAIHKVKFPDTPFYIPQALSSRILMSVDVPEEDLAKSLTNSKML